MPSSPVIGAETRVVGALSGPDDLVVDGTVDGTVTGQAAVTIGTSARIGGEVRGRDVTIAGALRYNVYASSAIRLTATAQVFGDLHAPRVAIDDGALFEGQIKM